MYEYLNGELAHILPTAIVVDVHGVGYQVVFANPYRLQDSLKKQIKVLVQQVVREDSLPYTDLFQAKNANYSNV